MTPLSKHARRPKRLSTLSVNRAFLLVGFTATLFAIATPVYTALAENDFLTRIPVGSDRINNYVDITNDGKTLSKVVILLPFPQSNIYQDVRIVETQGGQIVDIPGTREKHYRLTIQDGYINQRGYNYDVTRYSVRANLEQITTIYPYDTGSEDYQLYTGRSGEYADPDNPDIQSMGAAIWSQSSDILDYARRCYIYVADHFHYIYGTGLQTIATTIAAGGGDCGNLSGLFVSLLRYKDIPARHIVGFGPAGNPHVWADFYMERYGWIPVDVTYKDANPSGDYFGFFDGRHTVASRGVWFLMDRGDGYTFYTSFLQKHWWWWWWGSAAGSISAQHIITSDPIAVGNLEIAVFTEPGTDPIGADGLIELYGESGLIATGQTNADGVALFPSVTAGGDGAFWAYMIRVRSIPTDPAKIFGEEDWGKRSPGVIVGGQTNHYVFHRENAYVSNLSIRNKSTGEDVYGDTVKPNTPLLVTLRVTLPDPYEAPGGLWERQCRFVCDRSKSEPYDFDDTVTREMTTGSNADFPFEITPLAPGPYYYVLRVGGTVCTDGRAWAKIPLFTVSGTPPPPSQNLVANPGFEEGTTPWVFHTDGKGVFCNNPSGAGSPRSGQLAIEIPGTNVQLYQAGLVLEAGIRYRLSFNARSNSGHNVRVYLHQHDTPYTNYGLDRWTVDLGSAWKTFSCEFTAQNFTGTVRDARLRFWLAPYDAAGDVFYFDDVVLERADGSEPPIVVAEQPENPGFEEGLDPWVFHTDASGNFTNDVPGMDTPHAGHIAIGSAGSNVQLYQKDLKLKAGTRYRLSFRAYSSTGHNVRVYIHKHDKPYTNYGLDYWCVDLGSSWETFSREFTAENFDGEVSDARLRFWLAPYALGGDHYYLDDVALAELPPAALATAMTGEDPLPQEQPTDYALEQNYPNPFNPTTTIRYSLLHTGPVSLKVYNTLGQEVATLVAGEQPAGAHTTTWDASAMPSGVYYYRIIAGDYVQSLRAILMK